MKKIPPIPVLLLAILALLAALWAGLVRLGWTFPALVASLPLLHGPLMVSGFLGTLILLERVVALDIDWMRPLPLLPGLGWLLSLLWPGQPLGPVLLALGSLAGCVLLFVIMRRELSLFTATMGLGMLAWLVGNLLWLSGLAVFQVVYWWQAFLVVTIMGERIEISRILGRSRAQYWLFGMLVGLYLVGVTLTFTNLHLGVQVSGAAMLALAVWSLPNDIAWRNLRHKIPITRYIARALALGFVWLGLGGVLNLVYGAQAAGPIYDALLHAVFVGFVISMIFGHAPIIFPAILRVLIHFHPVFYVHLGLLHLSLVLRLAGNLSGWWMGRLWGGLLNEVAIVLFLTVTAWTVVRSKRALRTKS